MQVDVTVLVLQPLQTLGFFFLLLFPQQQQQLDRSAFTHLPSPFSAPPSNAAELSLTSQMESPDSPSPLLCATEPAGAPATAGIQLCVSAKAATSSGERVGLMELWLLDRVCVSVLAFVCEDVERGVCV